MVRPKNPTPRRREDASVRWAPCEECGRRRLDGRCDVCTPPSVAMPFRYCDLPEEVARQAVRTVLQGTPSNACTWCGSRTSRGGFCSYKCQVFFGLRVAVHAVLAIHPTCFDPPTHSHNLRPRRRK